MLQVLVCLKDSAKIITENLRQEEEDIPMPITMPFFYAVGQI